MSIVEQDSSGIYYPQERRSSTWFKHLFDERLRKLQPYPDNRYGQTPEDRFGVTEYGFDVSKLTYATLYELLSQQGVTDRFEIIVADEKESGYKMKHREMLRGIGIEPEIMQENNGVVFQVRDGRLFMILGNCNPLNFHHRAVEHKQPKFFEMMVATFKRYGVSAVLSDVGNIWQANIAEPDGKNMIIADKEVIGLYQGIAWEGFSQQFAQERGWSNSDYLRFRLTHQFPNFEE